MDLLVAAVCCIASCPQTMQLFSLRTELEESVSSENPAVVERERDLLRQLLVVAAGKHILSKRTESIYSLAARQSSDPSRSVFATGAAGRIRGIAFRFPLPGGWRGDKRGIPSTRCC